MAIVRISRKTWFNIFLFLPLLVSCSQRQKEEIVYLKSKDGNFDLYKSDVLGQWEDRLTTNPGWDWQPKWNKTLQSIIYYSYDSLDNFSVRSRSLDGQVETLPMGQLINYQLTPDANKIIYIVRDSVKSNIWWCDLDGSNAEALTNTTGYNGRVAVNPVFNTIAFISDRSGSNELYTLNMDKNELEQVTSNNLIDKYLTWSPDGRRIALTMKSDEEANEDIYVMNADGSDLKQITFTPYPEQEIAWSLSGDKIAFHGTTENDGDQIYTINLKDGSFTKITSGDYYHGEPEWIPIK